MKAPSSRFFRPVVLGIALVSLMACGATTTVVVNGGGTPVAHVPTATSTTAPTATATHPPAPTATPAPVPGVCNAADFPTKTNGGPSGFTYPPLTYYYDESPGAGNHPYALCSSGNATSIIAFMKTSIPAAGWKITGSTATTLSAENQTTPPSGSCYTVDITAGANASYPGEWSADFHPPIAACV